MTLLLVDDEKDTRTVARLSLKQLGGFSVIEAASGPDALDIASRTPLDAVILDVMMPGMDGPAVLAALRANPSTAGLPVIFLTAKAMPDEIARLRALGVVAIHTKPFDPAEFASQVRASLTAGATPTSTSMPGASAPAAPAHAPGDSADPADTHVDATILRRLRGLTTETGSDLASALIDLFETNTPETLVRIRQSMAEDGTPGPDLERLAHTLKSSAASLGAQGMAGLARTIETAAHERQPIDLDLLTQRISEALAPVIARLRAAAIGE